MHSDREWRPAEPFQGQVEQPGKLCEARRRSADYREHQRESIVRCPHDGLWTSTHTDPCRERAELRVRHDILPDERGASLALPGDGPTLQQLGMA